MTQTTHIRGPKVSATLLFRRIAPTYASELAQQLHRAGLRNSNDLIMALTTGLNAFSREMGVELAREFPKAWPDALRELRSARTEAEWQHLLPQTSGAPQAKGHTLARGASQMLHVLEAGQFPPIRALECCAASPAVAHFGAPTALLAGTLSPTP